MSYESGWVPGRGRTPEDRLFQLTADDDLVPDRLVADQKADTTGPPPSAMRRLVEHDESRRAALGEGDKRAAKRALARVAADLEDLLDTAKAQLRVITTGDPGAVRDGMAALDKADALATLPLADVAELLDLPRTTADDVLTQLREDGGPGRAERRAAVRAVDQLRMELQVVADAIDHARLDQLVQVITTVTELVAVGVAAGDDRATGEVGRTAMAALVALALERVADLPDHHALDARGAHEALLRDLPGETVGRTTVLVRTCAARVAVIPLAWADKQVYWDLLDRVAEELGRPDALARLRDELAAVEPPG